MYDPSSSLLDLWSCKSYLAVHVMSQRPHTWSPLLSDLISQCKWFVINCRWVKALSNSIPGGRGDIPPTRKKPQNLHSTSFTKKQGRTLSLPQLYMQFQSKRCPHSVTQLEVRSSKQSVHVLPALTDAGTVSRSRTVSFSFSPDEARSASRS